jgi:hypothetical protein
VISDMLRTNRTLLEDSLERLKQLQYAPENRLDPNLVRLDDAAQHPSLSVSVDAVIAQHPIAEADSPRVTARA